MTRLAALAGLAILAMTAGAAALLWRLTEPLPASGRAPERVTLATPATPEAPPLGPAPATDRAGVPGAAVKATPTLEAERAAAAASGVDWRTLERMLAEGQEAPGEAAAGPGR